MRPSWGLLALAGSVALASAWGPGRGGPAAAQEGPSPAKSARGGLVAKAENYQFEVLFYPTGVRVFAQERAGAAIDSAKLGGSATFYHPNSSKPWFARPLRAANESLDLAVGLGHAPPSGARVAFEITGLPDPAAPEARFSVPLEFAPRATARSTTAPPPVSGAAPGPRYVYAPGYYGYGYYAYPGPETVPEPAVGSPTYYGVPSRSSGRGPMSGHTVGPMHRDWATGRDLPLAKPWMNPRD